MRKKNLELISLAVVLLLAVSLPAQAASSRAAREKFTILFNSERGGPVIATGAFFASGTDVESPDGETSVFTFRDGTLTVRHVSTQNGGTFKFNDFTCVGKFKDRGTYRSISGTGAYQGVTVSGTFTVKGTAMHKRTAHGCSEEPISFSAVVHASGPVSFGK